MHTFLFSMYIRDLLFVSPAYAARVQAMPRSFLPLELVMCDRVLFVVVLVWPGEGGTWLDGGQMGIESRHPISNESYSFAGLIVV